jgi:cyanate permease
VRVLAPDSHKYDPSAWMLVFPLGMYATASQLLGATASLHPVRLAGEILTWPAATAWLTVLAAMAAVQYWPRWPQCRSRKPTDGFAPPRDPQVPGTSQPAAASRQRQ